MSFAADSRLSTSLRRGVLAALATPVDGEGRPDLRTFATLIDFVKQRGVDGVVIGGATGEYASFSLEQRRCLMAEAATRANADFAVLAGIGAQTLAQTLALGRTAEELGCRAVLLPMPYFFPYQADDLKEYSTVICKALKLPCLFYHLPSFTNALALEHIVQLLESDAGLAGIKDSSGALQNLAPLAKVAATRPIDLFAGDDSVAFAALSAGWTGVISGIACFLPELLVALVDSFRAGDLAATRGYQDDLDRVIQEVVKMPIPWAVRIGLEARGISHGPLPLPLSPRRAGQVSAYRSWCRDWVGEKAWAQPLEQGKQ